MGSQGREGAGSVRLSVVRRGAFAGGARGVAAGRARRGARSALRGLILAGAVSLAWVSPCSAAWNVTGASVYNGCPGAWGDVCGGTGFAELGGNYGVLMGGLAPGTVITIRYRGREVVSRKLDWGTGGGDVGGLPRGIDLPCSTAARLGIFDCSYWTGVVRWALGRPRLRHEGWRPRHGGRGRRVRQRWETGMVPFSAGKGSPRSRSTRRTV